MKYLWCDTETTGLEPKEHGAFEYAFILVDGGKVVSRRDYFCNPLSEGLSFSEDAAKVNGYTKERVEALNSEAEIYKNIKTFLDGSRYGWGAQKKDGEPLILAGYNVEFDKGFLEAMLDRHGAKWEDYFKSEVFDVYALVKKAYAAGSLPRLENLKLGTMCKAFGIDLSNAHTAAADIEATRNLAIALYRIGIRP